MKRIIVFLSLFFLGGLLIFIYFQQLNTVNKVNKQSLKAITPPLQNNIQNNKITPLSDLKTAKSIFIPYWTNLKNTTDLNQFDRLLYFGTAVSKAGIDKNEAGYKKMESFLKDLTNINKEKWLVIRMINTDVNLSILKNQSSWKKIADDSIDIVKNKRFDGIVLDLEMSILPLNNIMDKISDFVKFYYTNIKGQNIKLATALYGDVFYRQRPFDVKVISNHADEVMIMTYDFHKINGEPGPNFPLSGKEKYGYDLTQMIDDFLSFIPPEKLTIIFGMYGYDWTVSDDKRPLKNAIALTLNQINEKFIKSCLWKNCVISQDKISEETEINYVDKSLKYHIVWFEDEKSSEAKINFLKTKNINSAAFWAYGYY